MTAPRVLVVGGGSIGTRHATILRDAGAEVFVTEPDAERRSRIAQLGLNTAAEGPGPEPIDAAVIASPTSLHVGHAAAALERCSRVLVEKPLALDGSQAALLADADDDTIAVAYNLRFHEPVRRFVDLVHGGAAGDLAFVRFWFGSWLPDWRPQNDYRESYSARRDLGGGVLLDAIHELDLAVWLFGEQYLEVRGALVERRGPLALDVEDTVVAVLRADDGTGAVITLDYLSRSYRRGIEVVGDRATLTLDWARQTIEIQTASDVRIERVDHPLSQSYVRQADALLDWVRGGPALPVPYSAAMRSLDLADAIRAAAR